MDRLTSEEDIKSGAVEVIGQKELTGNLLRDGGILAPIITHLTWSLSMLVLLPLIFL